MSEDGTGYDFMPFDDDDDDEEASVATMLEADEEFGLEMAEDYDDDDEDGGGAYDDDDDDEEIFGTLLGAAIPSISKGIGGLFKGSRRNRRRVRVPSARNRASGIRGRRGKATIMTRRGPVSAQLQTRMVTPAELQKALAGVRRDIGAVRSGVRNVDRNAIKRDSATRKRSAQLLAAERKERLKLSKKIKDMNQQSLMMSLLRGDPQIETLTGTIDTLTGVVTVNDGATKYRDSDDLLPLMMMMGDGFGGGDMNPMMMMLMMDKL